MKRKTGLSCIVAVLLVFMAAIPVMGATIGLRPAPAFENLMAGDVLNIPTIGTQFDVELYFELGALDNIVDAGGIAGYTVDIVWDDLIGFEGFDKSDRYLITDVADKLPERIELSGYNFGAAITEDHVMGTFHLVCLGPGITELLPEGHFEDPINVALGDFTYLPVDFEGLTVSQVPIPSTLLLLGGGLVGLVGLKRRNRA